MNDPFSAARRAMVERQVKARGIHDRRVLGALEKVPRHLFVETTDPATAYEDMALPIACDQTISQPYIVGLMSEALELTGDERVLEIGTGSAYQAAILGELAAEVFTIERHQPLAEKAERKLNQLGYRHVHVRVGDGYLGWPEEAPFDRVIITAGAEEIPAAVWDQLKETGILVAPLGPMDVQELEQVRKIGGRPMKQTLVACRFVPLLPDVAGSR